MFYNVGSIGRYTYVFDSDDGSCELIGNSDLRKSGVVLYSAPEQNISINMLRMLYGFSKSDITDALGRELFTYSVGFNDVYADLIMRVILIPAKDFRVAVGGDYNKFVYGEGDTKFAILLNVEAFASNQVSIHESTPMLTRFEFKKNQSREEGWGMLIPSQMLNYIYNLAKVHDLSGIMSAMCGLYSDKLTLEITLMDKRNGYRYVVRRKKRTIGALNERGWNI